MANMLVLNIHAPQLCDGQRKIQRDGRKLIRWNRKVSLWRWNSGQKYLGLTFVQELMLNLY